MIEFILDTIYVIMVVVVIGIGIYFLATLD
jgi:hypothetical protein